jgi:hypothetical protein
MEDFRQHVLQSNPFSANAVNDPSGAEVDVETIHGRQFEELIGYAEEVHRQRGHLGQVVWGEPGIGKSHLLARLCCWADRQHRACSIFLHNIQPDPESLPRYVLKCVIHRLILGRDREFHGTALYWLVTCFIRRALTRLPAPDAPPKADQARDAYRRFAEEALRGNPNAGVDARAILEVLFRFFLSAYRGRFGDGYEETASLAVRWLAGDDLDRDEAAELTLRCGEETENPVSLPGKQAIESVLIVLAELAWHRGQPFVLCFDQVDNLTREQLAALTQFLHPLVDHARNLLVVFSGVQQKILDYVREGVILRAAWERIAQDERGIQLSRIDRRQARQLLEARLERFLEPFMSVPAIRERVQEDILFPLGQAWFEDRTSGLLEFRPRDAINWARDRWRQQQRRLVERGMAAWLDGWATADRARPAAAAPVAAPQEARPEDPAKRIDDHVACKIMEQMARRELEPHTLPPDAANLSGLVEVLLKQAAQADPASRIQWIERPGPLKTGRLPAYHLVVGLREDGATPAFRTGVTFIATGNATSTAAALRRILDDPEPPERVLVVSETRQPLKLGAKGQDYLDQLQSRSPDRFLHVEISFRQYAELDALQAVLGDARSGDLELDLPGGEVRRLAEDEVVASHHRQNRYRRHPLLGQLLAGRAAVLAGKTPG